MKSGSADIHPVYAVVGADRFLRHEKLELILRALAAGGDALEPSRFEGREASLADVLDELRTPSLLGDRRVVIVDEADPFITAHREALERYCSAPAVNGSLLLLCNTLPANTRLCKAIKKTGSVISVSPPRGRATVDWIIDRAKRVYRRRLDPSAARRLYDHVGDASGALDGELAKLTAFVGDRPEITPDDVGRVTGRHCEEKVFAVMDALASKDAAGAMRYWKQVLATDPAAPGRAIAGLAWGVRRLLEARRDWEDGQHLGALAKRMWTDPNTLRLRLERMNADRLERQLGDLLTADLAIKTGASTIGPAIERFIVTHAN